MNLIRIVLRKQRLGYRDGWLKGSEAPDTFKGQLVVTVLVIVIEVFAPVMHG